MIDVPASSTSVINSRITDRRAYGGRPWAVAWGRVAYAAATSAQSGISAEVAITGLSVTFNAVAGRLYEITARVPVMDAAAGTNAVLVYRGATRVGQGNSSTATSNFTVCNIHQAGSSGSVTFAAKVVATGGSGVITSSADVPSYISAVDIGPSGVG